jgi:hypothetical protein
MTLRHARRKGEADARAKRPPNPPVGFEKAYMSGYENP